MTARPKIRLSGWGRYPVGETRLRRPERTSELVESMSESNSLVARGMGRSYGDASFNSSGETILMERLNRLLNFDAASGILECEAGVTFEDILQCFVPRGFFPPVVPGTKFVSLGGAIACDVHGKNHHKDGSFARHVLDFHLLTPDGRVVKCSRDENHDLFWGTIGGMGLTGIVSQLRIRLIRIDSPYVSVDYDRATDLDSALDLMHESDDDYKYSVAWLDALASGKRLGRSVLMRGNPAPAPDAGRVPGRRGRRGNSRGRGISIPEAFPGSLLNRASIGAFNEFYYRKHPKQARGVLTHYEPFFFPLDGIRNWNRLYGKRGFMQYQVALPCDSGRGALVAILELIAGSPPGSFLAVLKRFGSVEAEHFLSFPMPGYTLSLDLPRRGDRVFELLERCDEIVGEAGGRVYLGKDARLSADRLHSGMYDRLDAWLEVKREIDPDRRISSDLAARLRLTG